MSNNTTPAPKVASEATLQELIDSYESAVRKSAETPIDEYECAVIDAEHAIREHCLALIEQNAKLDELVRGAVLLLNGDCPLSELNCDDWLRRASSALSQQATP
jgi:hypothetical protein